MVDRVSAFGFLEASSIVDWRILAKGPKATRSISLDGWRRDNPSPEVIVAFF